MPPAIKEERVGSADGAGRLDPLERVSAFRTEAFDLLTALTRQSTRTRERSALPEAIAEMQSLVNTLGGIERLLSKQPEHAAGPRPALEDRG